jgi:hypothetical protein
MSVLGRYVTKHGRPYSLRRKNGKGVMEVLFNDGYVTIRSMQPGTPHFVQEIHIVRSAWHTLVNSHQLETATEAMMGPDFDRYRAERRYAREEAQHLAEDRELKSQLYGRRRRRRRRRA